MVAPKSFRALIGLSPSTVTASSGSTALIIIDAQGTYAPSGGLAISGVEAAQKEIAGLVSVYRKNASYDRDSQAGAPVIWVQHTAGSGAPVFNPDNESFDFIGDVRPKEGEEIIVKQAPSSFTGTTLHETLTKLGAKQIVLTGYMAHVCVTGTARSAMELGYDVIIVRDAIGDRDIPSADGKSVVTAASLVNTVCDELADAIGTVILSSEVKA
ncbi:hypothetical protein P7C70_g3246, partial [Phenoliferia sp. Uapishka_3]